MIPKDHVIAVGLREEEAELTRLVCEIQKLRFGRVPEPGTMTYALRYHMFHAEAHLAEARLCCQELLK
jgi:hypothetical protein